MSESQEMLKKIKRLAKSGFSDPHIAKILCCSVNIVRNNRRRFGIKQSCPPLDVSSVLKKSKKTSLLSEPWTKRNSSNINAIFAG